MLIRCLSLSLVERSIGVYSAGNKQQQCFEVCILIYIYTLHVVNLFAAVDYGIIAIVCYA